MIKCEYCQAEFMPPQGKSLSSCPFCAKPLAKPTVKKCKTFAQTLEVIANAHGTEVLHDERLARLFTDYMPTGKSELHFLRNAFECGIPEKLAAASGKPGGEQQLAMKRCVKLLTDINMAPNIAEEYLWILAIAMGWEGQPEQPPAQPSPEAEDLYQQGEALWNNNDYPGAVACYRKAAQMGHAQAQRD